jgi:hypothetical protein
MKLVRLITMCLSKVCVVKYLAVSFPTQNGLNQEPFYRHCFSTLLYNMPLEGPGKPGGTGTEWDT